MYSSIWLDRLIAAPTLGVLLRPRVFTEHEYTSALRVLIDECLTQGGNYERTSADRSGLPSAELSFPDGYTYSVSASELTVQFKYFHHLDHPEDPGTLPKTVKYSHEFEPYGKLLENTLTKTKRLFEKFPGADKRTLLGLASVASCVVDLKSPPPGVKAFLDHLQHPWEQGFVNGRLTFVANLNDSDVCRHQVDWGHAQDVANVTLEWQRSFSPETEVSGDSLFEHLSQCIPDSIQYFERFGAGDLNYVSLGD